MVLGLDQASDKDSYSIFFSPFCKLIPRLGQSTYITFPHCPPAHQIWKELLNVIHVNSHLIMPVTIHSL